MHACSHGDGATVVSRRCQYDGSHRGGGRVRGGTGEVVGVVATAAVPVVQHCKSLYCKVLLVFSNARAIFWPFYWHSRMVLVCQSLCQCSSTLSLYNIST